MTFLNLKQGNLSSLNNDLWPASELLALAVITKNNGSSLEVRIAHNDLNRISENDFMVSQHDSDLPFDLVILTDETYSLPVCAFGSRSLEIPQRIIECALGTTPENFSKNSGFGPVLPACSLEIAWRKKLIETFNIFRTFAWRNALVTSLAKKENAEPDLESKLGAFLVPIRHNLATPNPLEKKSSQLADQRKSEKNTQSQFLKQIKPLIEGMAKTNIFYNFDSEADYLEALVKKLE
jgi:hypothetical protein